MNVTKSCRRCGSQFEGQHTLSYCSRECYGADRSEHFARSRQANLQESFCAHCGQPFEQLRTVRKTRKFCSHECYGESRRIGAKNCIRAGCEAAAVPRSRGMCTDHLLASRWAPNVVNCEQCGTMFLPSQARRERLCSKTCSATFFNEIRRQSLRECIKDGRWDEALTAIRVRTSITSSGCHEWQGYTTKAGYPQAQIENGRRVYVHRVAVEASLGKPLGEHPVHHKCANRLCVNPEHLQVTTHRENAAEMLSRRALLAEIAELRDVVESLAPGHPVLSKVSGAVA